MSLGTNFGASSTSWELDFYNPRVNDAFWGIGFDTHLRTNSYNDYDKDSIGFGARAFHGLGRYTLLGFRYNLEGYDIKNVESDAADSVKDAVGSHVSSSFSTEVNRSTVRRDSFFKSEGSATAAGLMLGGGVLGGSDHFVKWTFTQDYYEPILGELIFHARGGLGILHETIGGSDVPLAQRYTLGGINTVRGYTSGRISPRDDNGDRIGGNKSFYTNLEVLYPLDKEFGVLGVLFFDAGNAWKEGESFFEAVDYVSDEAISAPALGLYKSFGAGIRWMSPMGPLRFDYGVGLDELEDSGSQKFEFSMGQAF